MRLSLRLQVLLVVAGVNAAFFVLLGVSLLDRFRSESERMFDALVGQMDGVGYAVGASIRPEGELSVAPILQWPGWGLVSDAILVDDSLDLQPDGRIVPRGIDLNPLGAGRRGSDFDRQAVLSALRQAMATREPVAVAAGRAVPIGVLGRKGEVWGGCWVRIDSSLDLLGFFGNIVPLFLLSTLLLTAGTILVLRWLVIQPVAELAGAARRVQGGDFAIRLAEPRRRDEIAGLVRAFNEMTGTVESFNQRLADEVESATAQARRAEAEAMTQRRLAAMGELAAGIAHEINNPLGGLSNALERVERGDLTPEKRTQYLQLLHSGLERIGATVQRLLRFTPRQAMVGPVDLVEVVSDATALVAHRAEREQVALSVTVNGQPSPDRKHDQPPAPAPLPILRSNTIVWGERHELGQALLNLLVNALDAIASDPPAGRPAIAVDLASGPDAITLRVSDNGPGIPDVDLERVVDLFYTTKEVGKGSGLGLSIVHNVVAGHGGRLTFEPGEPRGLVVRLELPRSAG